MGPREERGESGTHSFVSAGGVGSGGKYDGGGRMETSLSISSFHLRMETHLWALRAMVFLFFLFFLTKYYYYYLKNNKFLVSFGHLTLPSVAPHLLNKIIKLFIKFFFV